MSVIWTTQCLKAMLGLWLDNALWNVYQYLFIVIYYFCIQAALKENKTDHTEASEENNPYYDEIMSLLKNKSGTLSFIYNSNTSHPHISVSCSVIRQNNLITMQLTSARPSNIWRKHILQWSAFHTLQAHRRLQ